MPAGAFVANQLNASTEVDVAVLLVQAVVILAAIIVAPFAAP